MIRAALAALALALVPVAVPAQAADAVALRLIAQTSWVNGTGRFDMVLAATGVADTQATQLVVSVYPRVGSRSEYAQSLTTRPTRRPMKQVTAPIAGVPTDGRGNLEVSLPMPVPGTQPGISTLPSLTPGVYPVTVEVRGASGTMLTQLVTHLVRVPDVLTGNPLDVAWVQPIGTQPSGGKPLADDDRRAIAALASAMATNPSVPLSIDANGETIAALPAADQQSLRSAIGIGHPLLAAPYVDVDPGALAASGHGDDIAAQRQAGEEVLATAFGVRGDPRTWSADRPVTAAGLARLRALGVTRVVLAESTLQPLSNQRLTLTNPYAVDAGNDELIAGVSADDGLAAYFTDPGDPVLAAHRLLADLAVLFFDAPGATRGVVVRPPATWRPNAAFLNAVLPALGTASIVRPVTIDTLFTEVPPLQAGRTAVVRDVAPTTRPSSLSGTRLTSAHNTVDVIDDLLGPGAPPAIAARNRLLAAESERLTAGERDALLSSVDAVLNDVRGRLRMPDGRTFRLTARSGTIPLTVVNDNPFPVRVDIVLSSEKLEFTDVRGEDRGRETLSGVVLQPGTLTRTVPVKARASAAFGLNASIRAPGGTEIVRSRFTIISTVFSGVGIVLSIGAGLFLAVWWARHWRSSRRKLP